MRCGLHHISQVSFLRSHDWHKLSQASVYRLGLLVWFTPQTERVVVLSKIIALNKSLALLLSVLLAASVGTIAIEQYRRISCHDNFVKAKDSSSLVRDLSCRNMTFYLNVFLITCQDVVGYYKFRNEVMVWFMQMICLHPIANDAEENPGPIMG